MTMNMNGQADGRCWADKLREQLHACNGAPAHQRPHDDPKDHPSLLA